MPLDLNSVIGSAAGGGLAVIIIRLVFGFVSRRDVTFEGVLREIGKNIATHTEVVRGLSDKIENLDCHRFNSKPALARPHRGERPSQAETS